MITYEVKVYESGSKYWFLNGNWHREDGPAVELANGTKSWWLNGQLHREDGPAIEWANGTKEWFQNGQPHREDGPAIEYEDGTKSWWLNGKKVTEQQVMKPVREMTVQEISRALGFDVKIVK